MTNTGFCRRSNLFRPLRSHYCSVTRRVVLNMDHFCPWVINTVGFYNRKFFVLFLMYTLLATSWVLATSLPLLLELKRTPGAMRALERRLGPPPASPAEGGDRALLAVGRLGAHPYGVACSVNPCRRSQCSAIGTCQP